MSESTRAAWDTAYIDNLPDSAFLYVAPGGMQDNGKTTPRSLRHFPVRGADGKVDAAHVRDALSRIPQANVSPQAKAHATAEAQRLLAELNGRAPERSSELELPPRDDLVRTAPALELIRSEASDMPVLHGTAAVFNEWTEIRSAVEGHFFERFMPGSFAKTISETGNRIRCLFHHGQDPSIGVKVLGPITALREEPDALHYEVQLLDTDYNRSLIPGLRAGLYGSSFRFGIIRKDDARTPRRSDRNPKGILERTINEAYLREIGPTPLPAYSGTTAAVRSLTDEFVLGRFPTEALLKRLLGRETPTRADIEAVSILTQMYQLGQAFIDCEDDPDDGPDVAKMNQILNSLGDLIATEAGEDEQAEPDDMGEAMNSDRDTAPSTDAAQKGTSARSAATEKPTALWGTTKEEKPTWLLR